MKRYILILLLLMCVAQWYVPCAMIAAQEDVLRHGKIFRFKTAPVDPSDPFRGKYITLSFEADVFHHGRDFKWEAGENVYVALEQDSRGFAAIADVTAAMPPENTDYLTAEVAFSDEGTVRLNFPFDRFYLEESKASEAEQAYWEANRADSSQTAYALVRIKNGRSALQDVMVNDRSIVAIVHEMNSDAD